MAFSEFVVDVHGDPENAELQQSDAKQLPVYRVHRRYRPTVTNKSHDGFDDSRSQRRYFFAFADKSHGSVRFAKSACVQSVNDESVEDFVPLPADTADETSPETEEPWMTQNRVLNERIRVNPGDISGWWALVQLQDSIPGLTKAARLEKRIAILRSAVDANPICDALWLAMIRYGAQSGIDVDPIWDQALRASPSPLTFERYIRASLSSFSKFSIRAIRSRFFDLLTSMPSVNGKLHVLSLWIWVERSAGYDERATAFCQSAIEFHLFCPEALLQAPVSARLCAFERFWESDVARVGEPGAPTWAGWYARGAADLDPSPAANDAPPLPDVAVGLRQWFQAEAQIHQRLPLRGDDDGDDLERVVIFDDIRPTLFDTSDGSALAVHLVDELLLTLGVPDACLTRARLLAPGDDSFSIRLTEISPLFDGPGFHVMGVSDSVPEFCRGALLSPESCQSSVAVAAIEQVAGSGRISAADVVALNTTKIMIESRFLGRKQAARSVKALLKRDRTNVELCHILAGLQDDPVAIYRSVLNSFAGADWLPPMYCLAWAAIEHAFDRDDDLRPWLILAAECRPSPDPVTSIQLSRARRSISKKLAKLADDAAWWRLPFASVFPMAPGLCLALVAIHLEYVCADIGDALACFETMVCPILPLGGSQLETVWASVARLLRWHARRHPSSCPPKLARTVFGSALELCPLSKPIWDAFIEMAPNAVAVRSMMDSCMTRLRNDGLSDVPIRLSLYAIVYELTQSKSMTTSRLHRLFEQALSANCRGVVLVWRLYLRFEIARGDVASARKVLYRAVDQCPGSRTIWLDSMQALIEATPSSGPGALRDNDLLELVTLMGEKGIRLHLPPPAI